MSAPGGSVALCLISHTNAGKTTLARTLLARDVGDVRDAPHVTTEATAYPLIETATGDALVLWDTPGFGDSARLAKRMAQQGNPIGWFLSQVWDRFRDRTFWLSQRAVRNVRDSADVVLYLVNATEAPGDAGYLASELALLAWMDKPIIALLNQTGPPRPHAEEAAETMRWQEALRPLARVRAVLPLDAFARCWVQEFVLFDTIEHVLPAPQQPVLARLARAWRERRWAQFDDAMRVLAAPIAHAICARVPLPPAPMMSRIGHAMGVAGDERAAAEQRALQAMALALDSELRTGMDKLIGLHEIDGRAAAEMESRVASDLAIDRRMDEGKAAAVGGVLSGAVTGLAADLAAGGLTFGAGMLAGAVLGALSGAGLARSVNVVRRKTDDAVRWSDAFLHTLVASALLRYLAVAHYGRGRGGWKAIEYPPFWRERVAATLTARQPASAAILARRSTTTDVEQVRAEAQALLADAAVALLAELYPEAVDSRMKARSP